MSEVTKNLSHNEAIKALCDCAATVTVLSYQEAIEGYFSLRGLPIPGSQPPASSPLEGEVRELLIMARSEIADYRDSAAEDRCYALAADLEQKLDRIDAALSTEAGSGEAGWIVSDGGGEVFRTWNECGPTWTADREKATRYARREDAEAVHAADEDAWCIEPYAVAEAGKPAPSEQFAENAKCPTGAINAQVEPAPSEERLREALDKACNTLCGLGYPNIASNIREFAALSGSAGGDKGGE